jgi:hypothetical protein
MSTIYRKTNKGLSEIETRANRLSPRLRSALIMVDGKKSDDDLRTLLAAHTDEALAQLVGQGFIEVASVAAIDIRLPPLPAAAPATAASAASTVAPTAPAVGPGPSGPPLEAIKREAVRQINDQIGPFAETLAIRIERAKTAAELKPLLESAWKMMENVRGPTAAAAFSARFLTW